MAGGLAREVSRGDINRWRGRPTLAKDKAIVDWDYRGHFLADINYHRRAFARGESVGRTDDQHQPLLPPLTPLHQNSRAHDRLVHGIIRRRLPLLKSDLTHLLPPLPIIPTTLGNQQRVLAQVGQAHPIPKRVVQSTRERFPVGDEAVCYGSGVDGVGAVEVEGGAVRVGWRV